MNIFTEIGGFLFSLYFLYKAYKKVVVPFCGWIKDEAYPYFLLEVLAMRLDIWGPYDAWRYKYDPEYVYHSKPTVEDKIAKVGMILACFGGLSFLVLIVILKTIKIN